MRRYLLDTNFCIRVIRDRPAHVRLRFNREASGLSISTVVLEELLFGAARSARPLENRRLVESFAERLAVLPFDGDAAGHSGDIRADLASRGQTIGPFDNLIAGHARSRGLVCVTANLRVFERVPGLRCENWLAEV
jgi:tRNA(fMet)-specific endonuclease VapC